VSATKGYSAVRKVTTVDELVRLTADLVRAWNAGACDEEVRVNARLLAAEATTFSRMAILRSGLGSSVTKRHRIVSETTTGKEYGR